MRVTSIRVPLFSRRANARAMTGAPCSGVKSPKNTAESGRSGALADSHPALTSSAPARALTGSSAPHWTNEFSIPRLSASSRFFPASNQRAGAPTGTITSLPRAAVGRRARWSAVSSTTTSAAARAAPSIAFNRRDLNRSERPWPSKPLSLAVSEAKIKWSSTMGVDGNSTLASKTSKCPR